MGGVIGRGGEALNGMGVGVRQSTEVLEGIGQVMKQGCQGMLSELPADIHDP